LNLKSSALNIILGFAKDLNADIASNVTKNATGSSPLAFLSGQLAKMPRAPQGFEVGGERVHHHG